jgi:CRP/FNR family cyclic AMP-dependent transcriptional regulator
MTTILELVRDLPEVRLEAGDVLCSQGERTGTIWVLVEGALSVSKGDIEINRIDEPGATVGEVAVLLGTGHTATVTASIPSRLHVATDGAALLENSPIITTRVATGLAERLDFVSTYLADLKHQYGDAPGLAMVGTVLERLMTRQGPSIRPGSARDPDPEY